MTNTDPSINQATPVRQTDATHLKKAASFFDLPLTAPVQKAIAEIGYEAPSPIQAQAIPPLIDGRDILGVAQTGTGKTAAFALPVLGKINLQRQHPQVLCLAPTRELAIQVAEAFQSYAKYISGFKVLPVYGGVEYGGQIRQLARGVHIVVGTPGRVMDHMRRGTLKLDYLQTLILDEADEMLRMGFIDDVEWILAQMPEKHQTALFSATMPQQIKKISAKYLQNPVEVTIKVKTTTAPGIRQRFLSINHHSKLDTLTRLLEVEDFDGILIFVRTKNATSDVADRLQARGYAVEALNGDIAQNHREKIVDKLKRGKIDIIVATDVAARGLDVERVSHVVNYDVPYDAESYVHRIGRTGRAGRSGDAILLLSGREKRMLSIIERTTRQPIEPYAFPSATALNERKIETLFGRIDSALQKDLQDYRKVLEEYLERNNIEPLQLAAALASIEAGGIPFYIKEPVVENTHCKRLGDNQYSGKAVHPKGQRVDRETLKTETYRLEVGEKNAINKGHIVGAIANEAGIESRYMGKIRMFETHSFIDLPKGMPKEIFTLLKKVRVGGRMLNISKASQQRRPKRNIDLARSKNEASTKAKKKVKKRVHVEHKK